MFPAATKAGGDALGFPDTCKVPAPPAPPVPTPFPNIAMLSQANGATCALKVKIMNQPAVHKSTMIPRTSGDEAGVAGGLVSGMNMGPAAFKMGVMMVKIEGNDAINQLKQVGQNGSSANAMGVLLSPSQTKVIING
ncbi:MAG: DUF4150 domain-containing protein [Myxococcales bacterium]|nr:DUF4150 domain-containing protein [Myxococcales bacterium]